MNQYTNQRAKTIAQLTIGILIGLAFCYLAFRKVNTDELVMALRTAEYRYALVGILVMILSIFIRAWRWQLLLMSIKTIPLSSLFSSLTIGLAANTFLPAHLGEFLRAFILGKKHKLSMSTSLASIVVERIIDVFSLLVLLLFVIIVHSFPQWVIRSGYIMLVLTVVLFVVLLLMKRFQTGTRTLLSRCINPLPVRFKSKCLDMIDDFIAGLVPLKRRIHFVYMLAQTIGIWGCYGLTYYLCIKAFHFDSKYLLPWYTSLGVLVITAISVVIPSSPGYIGTFHFLCQVSLVMFGVPASQALSYATVAHAVTVLSVAVFGITLANIEGVAIWRTVGKEERKRIR